MSDFVSRGFSGRRRVPDDVARRLPPGQHVETLVYTRRAPAGWDAPVGRVGAAHLAGPAAGARTAYVCGSHGFVETAARLMLAGIAAASIRTERFGPTG